MTASNQARVLEFGIGMGLFGGMVSVVTFVLDAATPLQLGPVPFFTGLLVFLVGLFSMIVAIIR